MADYSQPPGAGGSANPGWYADPWGQAAWRWWDGWKWTGWTSPPTRELAETATAPAYASQSGYASQPGSTPYSGYTYPGSSPGGYQGGTWASWPAEPPRQPTADAPAAPLAPDQRRRALYELLLVLAVFPAPYILNALVDLAQAIVGNGSGSRTPVIIGRAPAASFFFELFAVALPLAAALLVGYLLSNPGPFGGDWRPKTEGGFRAIGLDRTNIRGDLALVLGVFLLCFFIPILGGSFLIHLIGIHGVTPSTGGVPSYYFLLNAANGVSSGIVEEIVVLGFLVRRLEQLAVRPAWIVVLAVLARGSYHLYYGWGVLPILVWALVTVLLYRRFRRLLPIILVHVCWDVGLAFGARFHGLPLLGEAAVMLPTTIVFCAVWWNRIPWRRTASPT